MKKIGLLLMASALLFTACKNNDKKGNIAAGKKDSTGTITDGYNISAPAGWEKKDTVYEGEKVVFIRHPRENENDQFMENVNVLTQKVGNTGMDSYLEQNISQMESGLTNFVKVGVTDRSINGNDFKRMEYSHTYSGIDIDADVYFLIKNGTAYVITCSALKGEKEQYEPKFEEIIASFKIN